MKKNKKNLIVNQIEKVRAANNKNWMDLLRLALSSEPEKSSKILKKINSCDKKIAALLTKLS